MNYVMATAGHVDHGKSALVKRVTGMDPDRLAEEQARQMTIDLGFAWFKLPSGDEVGIVDVPGHRDFISNMLAGVGSIDAVVVVVAANEGVMPQTREHLAILNLLQVKHGVIAITKIDLVDDQAWLALVEQDVRDCIRGTTMQDFPFSYVSAFTGAGIPEFITTLQTELEKVQKKIKEGDPRLSIDRVFSIKGFGTVVTGTLLDGTLQVGQEIEIQPSDKRGRIRGIQTHKNKLEKAYPGSRVALNITGVDVEDIRRGDVVIFPGVLQPTTRLDAQIEMLPDGEKGLAHNEYVKIFHATAEVMGRVRTLGKDLLKPGESGFVQIELQEPVMVKKGDRFIFRRPSPPETLGGGRIIKSHSNRRYKRFSTVVLQNLQAQTSGSSFDLFKTIIDEKKVISRAEWMRSLETEGFDASIEMEKLAAGSDMLQFSSLNKKQKSEIFVTSKPVLRELSQWICDQIESVSSLIPGMPVSELSAMLKISDGVMASLLPLCPAEFNLSVRNGYVYRTDLRLTFSERDANRIKDADRLFQQNPFAPPDKQTLMQITGQQLFQALVFQGKWIPVSDSIIFRKSEFEVMHNKLKSFLDENGEITLSQFRDITNSSRKFALAFLEYMDKEGVTVRIDEVRKLKSAG